MTITERLENYPLHESQRGYFGKALYEAMLRDDKVVLITADLGYKLFDPHFEDFPDRCFSVGASEQTAIGVAVGYALEGYKPFVYTITSFFLRAAETISLYLQQEKIPVRLVGGGRDDDYSHDGVSHFGYEAQKFIKQMDFVQGYPQTKEDVPNIVNYMVDNDTPSFLSVRR